jgi:hypothetical protein
VTRTITGDVSGALADLGILVPLTAALVVVNGLDVGSVLLIAGLWMTDIRASLLRWLAVGVLIVAMISVVIAALVFWNHLARLMP